MKGFCLGVIAGTATVFLLSVATAPEPAPAPHYPDLSRDLAREFRINDYTRREIKHLLELSRIPDSRKETVVSQIAELQEALAGLDAYLDRTITKRGADE